MTRSHVLCFLFFLIGSSMLAADTAFWLRNTDPDAVFDYWILEGSFSRPSAEILSLLPMATTGRHPVAPGERVKIVLGSQQYLAGVFLPWKETLTYRTVLKGGVLLPEEVPSKGTLLVDRISFAAANRGRVLSGALQAWGLTVPQYALDGSFEDWAKVGAVLEWGSSFLPGNQPWSKTWPLPKALRAVSREGAFWIRFTADRSWKTLPAGISVSLGLRRPGALLEWPLTGSDRVLWSWVEGASPLAVGWSVLDNTDLEAWLPWDRFPSGEANAWLAARSSWVLLVTENNITRSFELSSFSLGELP